MARGGGFDLKRFITEEVSRKKTFFILIFVFGILSLATLSSIRNSLTNYNPQPLAYKPRPRILCMIFTTPGKWDTRGRAIRNTWGPRCYRSVYFYSTGNANITHPGIQTVALNVTEGRAHLTDKTRAAVKWSLNNLKPEVDWLLKADDDAYFVMENLERLIARFDLETPHYVGKDNHPGSRSESYASGGAGYLLNIKAAELLINGSKSHPNECNEVGGLEDLDVGKCLRALGVYLDDTADEQHGKKHRMHCNDPIKVMQNPKMTPFYYVTKGDFAFGTEKSHNRMLSPELISFHYVPPEHMYVYDFLLYDVRRMEL